MQSPQVEEEIKSPLDFNINKTNFYETNDGSLFDRESYKHEETSKVSDRYIQD